MRFVLGIILAASFAAAADSLPTSLKCDLRYQVDAGGGMVSYIAPENATATVKVEPMKVCNDSGCFEKLIGTLYVGTSVGAGTVRINGDTAIVVVRDGMGHKAASSIHRDGLNLTINGPATFGVVASGQYQDQKIVGILMMCELK